jgi:hypothetical protein
MRVTKFKYLILTIYLVSCNQLFPKKTTPPKTFEFNNGQWFDGTSFISKTMYVKDGYFTDTKPEKIDSIIDLDNKFVVPPFSEAHTHHLEGIGTKPQDLINSYLKDGVYYVKNPNNIIYFTKKIFSLINKPSSLDASFANGGLTANEAHPMPLFEDRIRPSIEPIIGKTKRGWFNGKAYYTINSEKELIEKWDTILADKPNFIKTYLANTEDYGKQSPISKYKLRSGLNPTLLPSIVAKAHSHGLLVAAHVETAFDFRTALMAGVDEIAHMPGFYLFDSTYSRRYLLSEEDAKLAKSKDVFVVTTLMTKTLVEDKNLLPIVAVNQKRNILLLKQNGVKLAIGSDHSDSPLEEIKAIRDLNVFTNLELLKLWCENSAQYIFPKRKIGFLKHGYEASFLVLDGNPLSDWSNTQKISKRIKQGNFLKTFK